MPKVLIRCVHPENLYRIRKGTYEAEDVGVYYGFHNYNRTAKQIIELIDIIQSEIHGIEPEDMEVYEIAKSQSDRHAHYTMIYIRVPADTVRENIDEYIPL